MSTIQTVYRLWRHAQLGASWRDKWLAFLLGGHACLGPKRQSVRRWFRQSIGKLASGDQVELRCDISGNLARLNLRKEDIADYLVGGEVVNGFYDVPNFTPDLIVDGGANIGLFSVFAAAHFPNVPIVCYEPQPANVKQLRTNLKANEIGANIVTAGLWSHPTTLYFRNQSSYAGYIAEEPPGDPVECVIPEVIESCWLKLDIEGAEYQVVPELLRRGSYPRFITMELHFNVERGTGLLEMLREHGYRVRGGEDRAADCANITAIRQI